MTPPSDAAPRPESESPSSATAAPEQDPADELPEWEPLTPELVEDEAIRGDAMLRNAMLLLAVLVGWTQIADSPLLVRIRSGEYMAGHGVLPPRTDPFSISAEGQPWVNLGWLSDLGLAGLYRLGGGLSEGSFVSGKLLTLWGVAAGFLTFLIVSRISIRGLPTWWSSTVGALAVVAAFPALTAGPASVTLLGTACLLWLLHRATTAATGPTPWPFAVLFVLWSNSDPLAWAGLALLWGASAGNLLTSDSRFGGNCGASTSLLKVAAISTAAAMLHPFHWHVLEAPLVLFGTELPEASLYGSIAPHFRWMQFSVTDPRYWRLFDWPVAIGAVLCGLTLITMLLNSSRASLAHVALFIVANGLAFRAGVFLPVASVVNAVLAGLNGQDWYSRTFRQTYSVAWTELLFSRAGRAATVVGLFTLAYLMINGALPGVDGRRLGMGFDWRLKTATASYATLAAATDDPRGFNGRPDHGDLMIWVGMKPFNDSRLALFARGSENLLELHRETFWALQVAQENREGTGQPDVWKKTFDRFQIRQVFARLTGEDGLEKYQLLQRKYQLLQRLMLNPELKLAVIDAAAARLDRADRPADSTSPTVVPQVGIDFIAAAFRDPDDPIVEIPAWPRELTTYERWLIQPEPELPVPGQLAQHLSFLGDELAVRLPESATPGETSHALRIEGIRSARRSLIVDANTPQVYRVLSGIYRSLIAGEQSFGQFGALNELRVRQWLAAEYFALLTTASRPADHEQLAYALVDVGYRDVALEHLQTVYRRTGSWTSLPQNAANYSAARTQNQALMKQLEQAVQEVQSNANREIQRGEDPIAVAKMAFDAGCPQFALSILEPLETQIIRDPMAAMLHAQVLMAVGRMEESWERLEGLEAMFPPDDVGAPGAADLKSIWRSNTAIANMVRGDYERALTLWRDEARALETNSLRAALDNVPLSTNVPPRHDLLAYIGARVGADALFTFPERWASVQMLMAVSELEAGRTSEARAAVQRVLTMTPNASIGPLAAYYHRVLTGESAPISVPAGDLPGKPQYLDALYLDDGSIADSGAQPAAASSSAAGPESMADPESPPAPPVAVPITPE